MTFQALSNFNETEIKAYKKTYNTDGQVNNFLPCVVLNRLPVNGNATNLAKIQTKKEGIFNEDSSVLTQKQLHIFHCVLPQVVLNDFQCLSHKNQLHFKNLKNLHPTNTKKLRFVQI